ncbi:MAG: glycosyltransferase family 2 protein [SAR202 cluster bacterium]|nr:glycosyltransferase family 2 protein [SAR202 cluster bacterium]
MTSGNIDLTVVVLTLNEELNLPECLESLVLLHCPVYVVDSGSTDGTIEIARSWGAMVVEHPFENYGAQRNWSQENLPINTTWVLHIDADERLTPELGEEIISALNTVKPDINGFLLRRRTVFLGKWIKHGGHYPSYHARLYRWGSGRCEDRLYDQHYIVNGRVEKLLGDMIDTTPELLDWTLRHARWAKSEAQELLLDSRSSGRLKGRLFGSPIERRRWMRQIIYNKFPPLLRALLYFLVRYVLRFGFLDGKRGLVFHFLQGFWYRFQVDAYLLENYLNSSKRADTHSTSTGTTSSNEKDSVN